MKKVDFKSNAPGKVQKALTGYWAFIPNPLPPDVIWPTTVMSELSKADRNLARLAEVGRNFPLPQTLMRPLMRLEAVMSSRIEGTHTSFEQLLSYEVGQLSFFENVSDAKEVHNYVEALNYGLEAIERLPISMRLIKEIHAVLMRDVRGEHLTPGEIRRSQNWIGSSRATLETARYVPPPVEEMKDCLSSLEHFIHEEEELPPLIRLGLIHYQFEAIHPFLDGNGRIGRLLIAVLLSTWGLLPQPLLYLSVYFEANRTQYYDHLLAVSQKGDWEAWMLFFLEGISLQAEDAIKRIASLSDIRTSYLHQIKKDRARKNLAGVIDYLISDPIISVRSLQKGLGWSRFNKAQRNINKLVEFGVLEEMTGQARNRLYVAREILKVLE